MHKQSLNHREVLERRILSYTAWLFLRDLIPGTGDSFIPEGHIFQSAN